MLIPLLSEFSFRENLPEEIVYFFWSYGKNYVTCFFLCALVDRRLRAKCNENQYVHLWNWYICLCRITWHFYFPFFIAIAKLYNVTFMVKYFKHFGCR